MGKKAKRERLRVEISTKIKRVIFLLEKIIWSAENELETNIFAGLAYDEAKRVHKFNQKIDKYL